MVYYITHTEPVNVQSGNLVRFFLRNFDEKEGRGHSLFVDRPVDLIIPSFEMGCEEAEEKIDSLVKQFPDFGFELKSYSAAKDVIWAILNDKKRKKELPKYFLSGKVSASQLLRFFYPPFKIVNPDDFHPGHDLGFVGMETVLKDTRCAIDIETTDYNNPDLEERITNTVLNFGEGQRKVIFTSFDKLRGRKNIGQYELVIVKDTDEIKQSVAKVIREEDPLMIYGFNIAFDQSRLRDLGETDFIVGVDGSVPVFKSVQAIRNMIEKGRFVVDLYGYLFYHRNIFKDNRLATHCGDKKSLSHPELEAKTKIAESRKSGAKDAANEIICYVAEDGDMTFGLAEQYVKEIMAKSWFSKREPSTICTASGKNIGKEMWARKHFFLRNTLADRYDYGKPEDIEFDPESKKDELFKLQENHGQLGLFENEGFNLYRRNGFFENLSLICPYFFIRAMWPMIKGTTGSLRFETADEKLNYVQTLNEYISLALERYFLVSEQKVGSYFPEEVQIKNRKAKLYVLNKEFQEMYGMSLYDVDRNLRDLVKESGIALEKSGVVNFSKKFVYTLNPEPLAKEGGKNSFGFVYCSGPTVSHENCLATLSNEKLIIQGFSITRWLSEFEKSIIEDALLLKLEHFASPEFIKGYLDQRFSQIRRAKGYELLTPVKSKETGIVAKIILRPEEYEKRFYQRFWGILSENYINASF